MLTKEKFRLTVRWLCFALLVLAGTLRLAAEPSVRDGLTLSARRLLSQDRVRQAFLYFGAGAAEPAQSAASAAAEPTEKTYPERLYTPPRVWTQGVEFAPGDAALVDIRNIAEVEFDAGALITQPLNFDASRTGPLVLIVHTHGTEAYTPTEENDYVPAGEFHTEDVTHNVVRVGQVLADRLNARGIETLNDETLCDLESYNAAYDTAADVIAAYLDKYPSIQMVIDLHRDAIEDTDGSQLAMTAELDGEDCARLLFVMGTNACGLEHPNWQDNLSCALKLQAMGEKQHPGWFRQMSVRSSRYNEYFTPCSVLLEVGAAGNTLEQAERSAERFGDLLADLLLAQDQ